MRAHIFAALIALAPCALPQSVQAADKAEASGASTPAPPEAKQWVIVAGDNVMLRAGPRDSARVLTTLWQGESLEVRGRQLDHLQVWDHRRERGGFVRAVALRELPRAATDAGTLVPVVGFLRDSLGQEALGIGVIAHYVQLADAQMLRTREGAFMLESLGWMADRFARRMAQVSPGNKSEQALLAAQLEVLARYGVNFRSFEREGQSTLCYDGEAHRRVLSLPASTSTLAGSVLAVTRPECSPGEIAPEERWQTDRWRADLIEQLMQRTDHDQLPTHIKQRLRLRAAVAWSSLAWQAARRGASTVESAARARELLAGVSKSQLTDADQQEFERAALRVNASRYALMPNQLPAGDAKAQRVRPEISYEVNGETCVALVEHGRKDGVRELARRCTYGLVWENSITRNPEQTAFTLAVQPLEAWRELWVADNSTGTWRIRVLPPADVLPGIGYAEFAGWLPGGKQMLLAREAQGGGRSVRSFSVVDIDSLEPKKQAQEPAGLVAFQRWPDAAWKRHTLALR